MTWCFSWPINIHEIEEIESFPVSTFFNFKFFSKNLFSFLLPRVTIKHALFVYT